MSPEPPLTVVAGYLGSGKTSLIIDLLSGKSVGRIGVIVNDFGELNIDAELLGDADGIVGFDNGCVCCSASDGLGPAIDQLKATGVEHIILEASGVSDPGPLSAWGHAPGLTPGGVIVCADVTVITQKLRDRWVAETVANQLGGADTILFTHDDIASALQRQLGEEAVRRRAPESEVRYRQEYGLVDFLAKDRRLTRPATPGKEHHADHETWTLKPTREVTEVELRVALEKLGQSTRRVKGFLSFPHGEHLVQMVGERVEIVPNPRRREQVGQGLVVISDRQGIVSLDSLLRIGFEINGQ